MGTAHRPFFLLTGELPEEQEEAEKVARRSSMYQFVDGVLYRKRPNGVKLKCIPREDGLELLAVIHGGICGSHIGSRALAARRSGKVSSGPLPSRMQLH